MRERTTDDDDDDDGSFALERGFIGVVIVLSSDMHRPGSRLSQVRWPFRSNPCPCPFHNHNHTNPRLALPGIRYLAVPY
jgi:hypothetical protein